MTELAHIQEQLNIYQQQLNQLELQIAQFGGMRSAPLHLLSQYETIKQQLAELAAKLPIVSSNPSQQLPHTQTALATYQQQLQDLALQIAHAGGRQRAPLALISQHQAIASQISELEATLAQRSEPT